MAGDWLKMRSELQSHPKVVRILSAMRPHDVCTVTDKFRVIGGLHAVWAIFDAHSVDGVLPGYTPDLMDHIIGWTGFSEAMISVGWLAVNINGGLDLPEFDEHNSQSAKRRAEDQKRKRDERKCPESVRSESGQKADKKRTREDKREDIKNTTEHASRFDEFWAAYPVKKGRASAEKTWAAKHLDPIADTIIADVKQRIAGDRQWIEGYIPHGSTYVNGRGWEDSIEAPRGKAAEHVPDYLVGAI